MAILIRPQNQVLTQVSNGQGCENNFNRNESVYELIKDGTGTTNTLINASEDIYELKIYSILGRLILR